MSENPSGAKPSKSGLAIAALILSVVALIFSLVPIVNNFAFVLVILAIILGVIGLVGIKKGNKSGMGIAVASLIISVIAVIAILGSQALYGAAADEASHELDKSTGNATEEIVGTDVNVDLGSFSIKKDSYGWIDSSLPVTVTNLTDEKMSFYIELEAVDASGNRIVEDYISANDLGAGQSQKLEAFTYVDEDNYDAMSAAQFQIVSVSEL
jgi:hypothetical protein